MKIIYESIFMSSLRAFFGALFGVLGAVVALVLVVIGLALLYNSRPEDSLSSSKVKILPDAQGHRKKLSHSTPVLLQIDIVGKIGTDPLTGEKIEEVLLDSREDDFKNNRVKGILLHINSPGGSVLDSDQIFRAIKAYKLRYNVPVIAFIDGLCASGGYYIGCAADKLFSSQVSLIGSIGVISWPPFFNVKEALEKVGIETLTVAAGKGKDQMNPFRDWDEKDAENYQTLLNNYYQQFLSIVADNRVRLTKEDLINQIGAKVFPADQALEIGLIDYTRSSRADALQALAQAAGIERTPYQVVSFKTKNWWKSAFDSQNSSPLLTGKIKHEWNLPNPSPAFLYP